MLKIAYVFDEDSQNNLDRGGIIQVRLAAPKQKKTLVRTTDEE